MRRTKNIVNAFLVEDNKQRLRAAKREILTGTSYSILESFQFFFSIFDLPIYARFILTISFF